MALEMQRPNSPALDALMGRPFPVLDHGTVVVVDYMGNDQTIVDAARLSYGDGTRKVRENEGLIRYLMRHRHTSPFEQCSVTFQIRMPIFVMRQWVRHRTAKLNEESGRYSVLRDEWYQPTALHLQSQSNRQGRGDVHPDSAALLAEDEEHNRRTFEIYQRKIEAGVSREEAREHLPLSTYTTVRWQCDLHNLLHFLHLRTSPHAQWEIQEYARTLEQIVCAWVPITYAAWVKHVKDAVTLTREEYEASIEGDNRHDQ